MEFRVLGPVEIRAHGHRIDIGHAKQRAVLAVLLLNLGRAVSAERLIDRVWGQERPASVRNLLYGYVGKLKAAITDAEEPRVILARRSEGYLLEASPEQVDLYRFRRQLSESAAVKDDDERIMTLLGSALGLWHGPALAGLHSPWLDGMRESLELQRIGAVCDLNDLALRRGHHDTLIGELPEAAATHPANERLIGQLMLALYRSGRQGEALRWFEQTRRWLASELGVGPGPELRALHQRILRGDSSLAAPRPADNVAGPRAVRVPVPRQLPPDVRVFIGRTAELAALNRSLATATADGVAGTTPGTGDPKDPEKATTALISAVSGTAGAGKTALVLHWAHQVAERFPDGQLYIDLRGYGSGPPMPAADALAEFLRALGVPDRDIPAEADERAARYRSLLAGRRMLVVLDNAGSGEQVRPLLPGTGACPVVVTSRDALAGLVARDGARRIDLSLLPLADATCLLRAYARELANTTEERRAALTRLLDYPERAGFG
jgi:DNA-binding SARP family transcriptional activator